MADVNRLSALSFRSSSASLLTSYASTLNSRQLGLPPNFNPDRKSCSFSSSVAGVSSFPSTSRKQLLSFKVKGFAFLFGVFFLVLFLFISQIMSIHLCVFAFFVWNLGEWCTVSLIWVLLLFFFFLYENLFVLILLVIEALFWIWILFFVLFLLFLAYHCSLMSLG